MITVLTTKTAVIILWVASIGSALLGFFMVPVIARSSGFGRDSPCLKKYNGWYFAVLAVMLLWLIGLWAVLFAPSMTDKNNKKYSIADAVEKGPSEISFTFITSTLLSILTLFIFVIGASVVYVDTWKKGDACNLNESVSFSSVGSFAYIAILGVLFAYFGYVKDYAGLTAYEKITEVGGVLVTDYVVDDGVIHEAIKETGSVTDTSITDEQRKTIIENILNTFA